MRRPGRAFTTGGWVLSACALIGMAVFDHQAARLYAVLMMAGTCAGAALHTAYAMRSNGRERRLWALTATALAFWGYAEVSVGVSAVIHGVAPGRTVIANLVNLGSLVLAVVAMLAIPTAPRTAAGRLRMILDGVVATSALLGVVWALALAPMIRLEGARNAIFDLAYPVLAVGVLAVAVIVYTGQAGALRGGAMRAITGGVLLVSLTLLVEVIGQVAGVTWLRPVVLDGYVSSAWLLAVAPLHELPRETEREWRPAGLAADLIPYVPVVALLAVCVTMTSPLVWFGSLTVTALMARQFVALRRNAALARDLADQAVHDPLTGLPNRALFADTLRTAGPRSILLMIDLDGFKAVNDTLGHAAGDHLLIVIGQRLSAVAGPSALVARLGGDEFAVLLHGRSVDEASVLASAVLAACAEPVEIDGRTAVVGASVGLARGDSLAHHADLALYQAKQQGKSCYRWFGEELVAASRARAELVAELSAGRFELEFSPAGEARLRWRDLGHEEILEAAAEAGLLTDIEQAMLTAALSRHPGDTVIVPLSTDFLTGHGVVLSRALAAHPVPVLIKVSEVTAPVLHTLRLAGARVLLDGYGEIPLGTRIADPQPSDSCAPTS
ncbi:GGDEF domain-containing protein [Actinoplanes sp. NPDC051851]|uniref:GGDEF domain-containing protein n=1 Tax=Actinoplanes sp. NPDC051851 TaxID=3154753 RepID=UPI00343B897C